MSRSGLLVFAGKVNGRPALFKKDGTGPVKLVTGYGQRAPGLVLAGRTMGEVSDVVNINDNGVAAFRGALNTDDGSAVRGQEFGVWTGPLNDLAPVALYGQTLVPGLDFVRALGPISINIAGDLAFEASPTESGVGSAIVKRSSAGYTQLARLQTAGPGMVGEERWGHFSSGSNHPGPILGGDGKVTFTGGIVGAPNSNGVWRGTSTQDLVMVLRTGMPAPGVDGVSFGLVSSVAANAQGDVVLLATLQGVGLGSGDHALVHWHDGVLQVLLRRGDLLEVAPGDYRSVARMYMARGTNGDGLGSGLSDARSLVLGVDFTDQSSGVFVLPVPSPPGMITFGFMSLWAVRRRR